MTIRALRWTLLLALAPLAVAQTTLTFNDLPNEYFFSSGGQNIGTYYPGAIFGPNVTALSVSRFGGYSSAAFPPQSGDVAIWDATDRAITITFTSPIQSFSIWYTTFDPLTLQAYDQNNNLLGTVTGMPNTDGVSGSSSMIQYSNPLIKSVSLSSTAGLFTLSVLTYLPASSTPSGGSTPTITSLAPNVVLVGDDGSLACYPGQGAGGGICFNPSGTYQFSFSVFGTNFTSSSAIQWNGSAISTTYVSATEVEALVPGSFLTSPGPVPITVSSGGQTSAAAPFTVTNFSFQRVSTQAPPADGSCVAPPPVTSFLTTDNTVYLYFFGIVTASDSLEADWIAPDGTISTAGPWPSATGTFCFDSRNLSIGSLPASRLGSWNVRVSNNGRVLFTVPFTVSDR